MYKWHTNEVQKINSLSMELWRKAYLIEFMNEEGTEAEAAFTFSVPPENEELTYSQRKTETKTFGGLHVDDYGIDAVKIALSGSTINQELKKINNPKSPGDNVFKTGEEEIYLLRDMLNEWKSDRRKITRAIILYDLSKMDTRKTTQKNYWRVFPGDFKISRGSEKPFTYKYAMDFTGVDPIVAKSFDLFSKDSASETEGGGATTEPELTQQKVDDIKNVLVGKDMTLDEAIAATTQAGQAGVNAGKNPWSDAGGSGVSGFRSFIDSTNSGLMSALNWIDDANGWCNNVLQYAKDVSKQVNLLGDVMKYATSTVNGIMGSIGDTAAGFIDAVTNVVDGVHTVVALPRTIQLAAVNIGLQVYNSTKGLMRSTAAMVDECRKMFDPDSGYWDMPQETLDRFGMTSAEFKDAVAVMANDLENTSNELVAAAKSAAVPNVTMGTPDPATGATRLVLSYGDSTITLKSTDTLESLAAKYYGSTDNAIDIATYNGAASLDELEPGDTIKIPILTKSRQNTLNRIYARPEDRGNYGRDIALTEDGSIIAAPGGDYQLTDGANNLSQAILLRLRESVNKRIRLNAYGIRTNISDPTAGVAYVLSSIDLTVRSDPRVQTVDDINFTGRGDSLMVTVCYRDINNASGAAAGRA